MVMRCISAYFAMDDSSGLLSYASIVSRKESSKNVDNC